MDAITYASTKALTESYIRDLNTKPDIKTPRPIPSNVKPLYQTAEERATALNKMAEMDKHATETRASVIKQYGTDPMVPDKIERTPMTDEEQAAYVQATLDRLMEGDAKYQKLIEYRLQHGAEALAFARRNPLIDTSA